MLGALAFIRVSTRIEERALKMVLVFAVALVYLIVIPLSAFAALN